MSKKNKELRDTKDKLKKVTEELKTLQIKNNEIIEQFINLNIEYKFLLMQNKEYEKRYYEYKKGSE